VDSNHQSTPIDLISKAKSTLKLRPLEVTVVVEVQLCMMSMEEEEFEYEAELCMDLLAAKRP
jgi:hypothetical protein